MSKRSIAVIGSLNVDFTTRTPRIPGPGETLTANSFDTGLGGKGANQAVACARLAGDDVTVSMVGNVGDDIFGDNYYAGLAKEGINTTSVKRLRGQKTGVANIIVDEGSGENRILFTANANYAYPPQQGTNWDIVPDVADVLVFQLEIPMEVVLNNLHLAREKGRHTILNPAPAKMLPDSAYRDIDTLVMNESESAILAGPEHQNSSPEDLVSKFLAWGVKETVIITLGGDGLVYATASGAKGKLPAKKVEVTDTTAAGDTFVGGYVVERARHKGVAGDFHYERALDRATVAAAKTVSRKGAMDAIPYLHEL